MKSREGKGEKKKFKLKVNNPHCPYSHLVLISVCLFVCVFLSIFIHSISLWVRGVQDSGFCLCSPLNSALSVDQLGDWD